ncbi:enoyl-CoA hydratase-related protein [Massilia cavernae]|uniref:Enoyl-CoA hydratase n=1 Tax=Massilia cavernae TaxID=2320864 RepID=A0A418Y0S0_9BURK|nr:enoyl-CoA hydratase-related protein [Massilia cavernae]RJG18919.1 enoyl-CoA hydratase [Massilia cavernae]
MANPAIRFERDGDIGVVTFINTAQLNPLSADLQTGLREILAQVRGDPGVRALVLTGEGRGFCVGADLKSTGDAGGDSLGNRFADYMEAVTNRLIEELHALRVPVISAINGAAAGAGVGLALAADVVVAARSAYFYLPFMPRLGLVPDMGATWFLPRLAGRSRAIAMALLDERVSAAQALEWGMVWSVVDDAELRPAALALARRLAALPANAALEIRRAFDAGTRNPLVTQLSYETERQRELLDRAEFAEGVNAFLEKRGPVFAVRTA